MITDRAHHLARIALDRPRSDKGVREADEIGERALDEVVYRLPDHPHDIAIDLDDGRFWLFYEGREVRGPRTGNLRVVYHGVRLHHLIRLHPKTGTVALRQLLIARPELDYRYERRISQ